MARAERANLDIVVGAGGVGKTTVAAALALDSAREGHDTLVMTFDPSLRLKDTLGVGDAARDREVDVAVSARGRLAASLLDARATFDRLVERYAPDEAGARRILTNRYYCNLAGSLAGVLEYMAVERLYEVASEGRYARVVLDTPPTRQALDFLEAPRRIVGFLDSGALRLALRPWFDERGRLASARRFGPLGRGFEAWLDRIVGLGVLRDMAEFFLAFGPLYDGFRERAHRVETLLRSASTRFLLVTRPDEERLPETLFFARRLAEAGYRVGPVIINMCHPEAPPRPWPEGSGASLVAWLGARDARGLAAFRSRLSSQPSVVLPLLSGEPNDLATLDALRQLLADRLTAVGWPTAGVSSSGS